MASQRTGLRTTGSLLCMAVAFALSPMQALAIGMGAIEVKSKLDQPFVAEIPLTLNDPSEANDLIVHLASPEAFARIGLDRSVQVSANLTFSIGRNERGQQVIRVTTPQKMHDPYVSFLLEADWGKGKMVREYTALLDPPRSVSVPHRAISAPQVASTPMPAPPPPQPAPMVSPPSIAAGPAPAPQPEPQRMEPIPSISAAAAPLQAPTPAAPPQPQISAAPPPVAVQQPAPPSVSAAPPEAPALPMPQPPQQPIATAPQPEPAPPPAPPQPAPAPTTEPAPASTAAPATESAPTAAKPDSVTVEKGDTLSQIAGKVRPEDVSVNRMMIALQRANPDAFIHSNINLLKSGAVLRIPGGDDTQALTTAEADSLVREQVESWRQGFQAAPPLQPEEGAETAVAKTAAKSVEAAAPAPAAEKLSTPPKETGKPVESTAAEPAAPSAPTTASVGHRKPRSARLEIVPPVGNSARGSQSGASEGGSGSELRAQLTQAKEELAARNAEVSDLKSRVSDLEKIQKDSQQLITMKDSQLADLQHKLAELEKQKNTTTPAPATSGASTAAAPPAPATTAAAASATPSASTASAASASKPTAAPAKHAVAPPAQPVDETPWFMQTWFWFGAGSLLVAALLYVFLRKPKRPEAAAPPRKYALAESLAALNTPAAKDQSAPDAKESVPAPAVTGRTTVAEPLPPAPPPISKPYWTGPVAATPLPEPPAAPVPPPAPAPVVAAASAPEKDDWAIDETPAAVAKGQEITKEHPVVPELDDPNQTVATKLELARAYIDIGDHDGARGMLEEVLIEGNAPQQEEAFKLLETLDS